MLPLCVTVGKRNSLRVNLRFSRPTAILSDLDSNFQVATPAAEAAALTDNDYDWCQDAKYETDKRTSAYQQTYSHTFICRDERYLFEGSGINRSGGCGAKSGFALPNFNHLHRVHANQLWKISNWAYPIFHSLLLFVVYRTHVHRRTEGKR